MKFNKIFLIFLLYLFQSACADLNTNKNLQNKKYYSSSGFALIYSDKLFYEKIVNKKINNTSIVIMHNFLKTNTPVKIINPINSKFIDTKVFKQAVFPNIFHVVISQEVSSILELDKDNPYVEIFEIKKNKTFIAKKSNTFDEEKNVAEKAPINEIEIDNLNEIDSKTSQIIKKENFIILISDFYYLESAISLKNNLTKKIKTKDISIKKINNNKYRLFAGPFENFNALKNTYISLNNLGFDELNVYNE
jgi:hypothetical protein